MAVDLGAWLTKNGACNFRKDRVRVSVFALPVFLFPPDIDIDTDHRTGRGVTQDGHVDSLGAIGGVVDSRLVVDGKEERRRGLTCLLCGLAFASLDLQMDHFKSQLHGTH
jgi:hypothetical protein